jgi:hypothetical protein
LTSPPDPPHHATSEPAPPNFHHLRDTTVAQEALHSLYFGLDAETRLAAYEALRQRLEKELRRELEAHPEAFANECNSFFSDLTAGALDYP